MIIIRAQTEIAFTTNITSFTTTTIVSITQMKQEIVSFINFYIAVTLNQIQRMISLTIQINS